MRDYLRFIAANPRFLSFGVLGAFFSSFGQTFFVALFGGQWRAEFDLSHGDFGALYSLGTLASGLVLIWLGRKIDRIDRNARTGTWCILDYKTGDRVRDPESTHRTRGGEWLDLQLPLYRFLLPHLR